MPCRRHHGWPTSLHAPQAGTIRKDPPFNGAQAGSFAAAPLKQSRESVGGCCLALYGAAGRPLSVCRSEWSGLVPSGVDRAGNVTAAPERPCWRVPLQTSACGHVGIARVRSSMRISMSCCSAVCTNCLPPARSCSSKSPAPSLRRGQVRSLHPRYQIWAPRKISDPAHQQSVAIENCSELNQGNGLLFSLEVGVDLSQLHLSFI